jgi:hypothetical protein
MGMKADAMMPRAVIAGLIYFAIVFVIGFGLGALRVLVIAPQLGTALAVLIELPVILGACWLVSARVTRALIAPGDRLAALVMGAVAFLCLMTAELVLGGVGFGRTLADQLAHWLTFPGAVGLAGQIAFAAFPWIQVSRSASI